MTRDKEAGFVHILTMRAVSIDEATEDFDSLLYEVMSSRAPVAITLERGESAVLLAESEWTFVQEAISAPTLLAS